MNQSYRKKLIEVALPLPEINDASAYDKMPGIGPHPKGIHHWWARLPLPTARAVLFASVVTDPSDDPAWKDKSEEEQNDERERLFDIIRRMMQKKLHEHPEVYAEARVEMLKHCNGSLPPVFDPFAGGGSIPLEASRLGFEAHAGDLNPVAVLLNKCNLEIAPRWAGHPPINPESRKKIGNNAGWKGTRGLAEDVRYYGRLIRKRVIAKIGHLYPKVTLPKEHGGGEANVIAWIWARTVSSPDPSTKGEKVPLISTFWLSNKKGNFVWLEPIIDKSAGIYHFKVRSGTPHEKKNISSGTKGGRASFRCIFSGTPISNNFINEKANANGFGTYLLAIVAQGKRSRIYLPANSTHVDAAQINAPEDILLEPARGTFAGNAMGLTYGFKQHRHYFTARQLNAMMVLSNLLQEIEKDIYRDAIDAGLSTESANAYVHTVITFLALALDRCADFNNALCGWSPSNQKVMHLFGRQAIPMVWDFTEANILGDSVGAWSTCSEYVAKCIEVIAESVEKPGQAHLLDAAKEENGLDNFLVSTDPPYYDNIGYGAISDFFYVWLRRTVGKFYLDIFNTILSPKDDELTASPTSGRNQLEAKTHFESGFRKAFNILRKKMNLSFPLTVYYAFKQEDEQIGHNVTNVNSGVDLTTGWETLLDALISSGFQITATWPVRASQKWRMVSMGTNALASYIVLACRPRPTDALQCGRREFLNELKRNLPPALRHLQQGNVAPVDFAQAAIGPGMAIYSKYSRILEPNGEATTVRTALGLINQMLTEVLSEQEDEFDNDTRWALVWFEQKGFAEGDFG
nr:DUF1156 domain-containing protein [Candidatus Desulfatibia profunda]